MSDRPWYQTIGNDLAIAIVVFFAAILAAWPGFLALGAAYLIGRKVSR